MSEAEKRLQNEFIEWTKTHQISPRWQTFVIEYVIPRAYRQGQQEAEQWMRYQNMPKDRGNP